jgi:DNA-directed RNA polymerase specialized sigma24 family protein
VRIGNALVTRKSRAAWRIWVARGRTAFETFFEREYPTLVRLLFAMTSDLAEAEDLAQEAMSRMWEHWATFPQSSLPPM